MPASHAKINSSNFVKSNQEPAAAIKKLKEFKQLKQVKEQSSVPPTPASKSLITAKKLTMIEKTQEETKDVPMTETADVKTITGPFTSSSGQPLHHRGGEADFLKA